MIIGEMTTGEAQYKAVDAAARLHPKKRKISSCVSRF